MRISKYSVIRKKPCPMSDFLFGVSKSIDLFNIFSLPKQYTSPSNSDFFADCWKQVGDDLRNAIEDYENE